MSKIHVFGHIAMTHDEYADLGALFAEHVALSRAEPGCERFDAEYREGPPAGIYVDELYQDREAFEAHKARTRNSEWGTAGAHLPRQIEVRDAE